MPNYSSGKGIISTTVRDKKKYLEPFQPLNENVEHRNLLTYRLLSFEFGQLNVAYMMRQHQLLYHFNMADHDTLKTSGDGFGE